MIWWARNRINIRCTRCGKVFEGAMNEPMEVAWREARALGWRARQLSRRQARETGAQDDWLHNCPGCVPAPAETILRQTRAVKEGA